MSDKIININKAKQDVSEILTECSNIGFDEIVIVGIKDGKIHFKTSDFEDVVKTVGSLELAKSHVLDIW